jgi:4-aminobutyrate aminotransferase
MSAKTTIIPTAPKLVTPVPGPAAQRVIAGDEKYISPSYTRGYGLVAKRGYGCVLEDQDGNQFLDFAAGIAVTSTGHCHPEVVAAIQKQAAELIHMSGTDFYYENMVTLAEKLSAIAPMKGPHKVYYGNSGAEAVECALKLARYHTKRQTIIAYIGAFHGRTMGALSLTASKPQQKRRFAPLVPGIEHVPYPNVYRRPEGISVEEYSKECASYIEDRLFKTFVAPEEVAAIFIEAIQGEGGYLPAPVEYLREVRRICDKYGILMVCDEVQSGCGRTGKWWAIQHSGVEPDIITAAKGIASGMPLGACIAKADIMDWVPGSHASTFGGNPVCNAAAIATLNIIERELLKNAEEMGNYIMQRISKWPETLPMVGDVRGRGLMLGVEIVKDKKTKEPAGKERDQICDIAFTKGLLLLGAGPNTLRICPPLIVNRQQIDVALDIMEAAIKEVAKDGILTGPGKLQGA